ncbi:MAG: phosphatase PAP2 family protein [Elusimicrobia bacterium]|nr:phosphatase PAP2 family protein [Elusimicrobiota bacterium]
MPSRLSLAVLLAVLSAVPARAASAVPPPAADRLDLGWVKTVFRDAGGAASSPARWDRRDWAEAGAVAAVGAGLYAGVDPWAQSLARRSQSDAAGKLAGVGQFFGNGFYTVPLLAASYFGARAAGKARLADASLDAVESLAISGLFVTGIKIAAGRERPYVNGRRGVWTGPGLSNDRYSFPSGHSSDAFSVATVFALEYGPEHRWVPPAAYGLAALTAASRVYNDKHWTSDVFVGSALGWAVARYVVRARSAARPTLALVPILERGGEGAVAVWRF